MRCQGTAGGVIQTLGGQARIGVRRIAANAFGGDQPAGIVPHWRYPGSINMTGRRWGSTDQFCQCGFDSKMWVWINRVIWFLSKQRKTRQNRKKTTTDYIEQTPQYDVPLESTTAALRNNRALANDGNSFDMDASIANGIWIWHDLLTTNPCICCSDDVRRVQTLTMKFLAWDKKQKQYI
jgi:hypothetical protein